MPSELYPVTIARDRARISAGIGKWALHRGLPFPLLQTRWACAARCCSPPGVPCSASPHPGPARAGRAQPGRHGHQHACPGRPAAAGGRSGISALRILISPGTPLEQAGSQGLGAGSASVRCLLARRADPGRSGKTQIAAMTSGSPPGPSGRGPMPCEVQTSGAARSAGARRARAAEGQRGPGCSGRTVPLVAPSRAGSGTPGPRVTLTGHGGAEPR